MNKKLIPVSVYLLPSEKKRYTKIAKKELKSFNNYARWCLDIATKYLEKRETMP